VKADPTTDSEVQDVLREIANAYHERSLERALACFAPDPDVVLYGTGGDEKRVGLNEIRQQIERDWSQTESTEIVFDWVSVSAAGDVAWAAADGTFRLRAGGDSLALPARITTVLEKRHGRWLIVHQHFSLPAQNQQEGSSF
jgi:uncharacterized protein (TIGR02246 family)